MPHSLQAKKRLRQSEDANQLNRWRKRSVKFQTKAYEEALRVGDVAKATEEYRKLTKQLDKIASKGTIHKKQADRRKSRLAKRLNALSK